MIPKNIRSKDMVGMEVKTTRAIKNGAGIVVPKGKIVKIASFGRAFTIRTEDCPHCGLSAYISGVTRDEVELISENNAKKTNADIIKSMNNDDLAKLLCDKFCHGVGENLIKEWLESECDTE